jgi:carbamoyltransferase
MHRSSYVIGISAFFHDSSCCLLRDGVLVAAASEERFTRIKHDGSLPENAFRYCLREGGININDVSAVGYYEEPVKKLGRQLWMGLPGIPASRLNDTSWFDVLRPEREILNRLGIECPLHFFGHHASHAASAFFFSGFPEAAIMTVDGVGEWSTTAYWKGAGSAMSLLEEVDFPDSLGLLYSAVTGYLGFEVNEGEYKVMGLAPYGQPRYMDKISSLIANGKDGSFRLDMKYFDFLRGDRMHSDAMDELFGQPTRLRDSEIDSFHYDVAASLQKTLEEILLQKVQYLFERSPSENLCMAGGVALNCVANARLLKEGPFQRLFVQPASSDAGGALGAAALAHIANGGTMPVESLPHVYLGRSSPVAEIRNALSESAMPYLDFEGKTTELIEAVVDRLAAGKVIGWFHGRDEFGPRALGSRSILADPRPEHMRDHVNALVKLREGFRPFAPAVPESCAADHFDIDHPSRFMLETCQVTSSLSMPAITHVDGSARVQTVDPQISPRFHALLEAFGRRTGCPVLLNTSFNVRGEPIVSMFMEALRCLIRTEIDSLVLEDFLLDRDSIPTDWFYIREVTAPQVRGVGEYAYTFF